MVDALENAGRARRVDDRLIARVDGNRLGVGGGQSGGREGKGRSAASVEVEKCPHKNVGGIARIDCDRCPGRRQGWAYPTRSRISRFVVSRIGDGNDRRWRSADGDGLVERRSETGRV